MKVRVPGISDPTELVAKSFGVFIDIILSLFGVGLIVTPLFILTVIEVKSVEHFIVIEVYVISLILACVARESKAMEEKERQNRK